MRVSSPAPDPPKRAAPHGFPAQALTVPIWLICAPWSGPSPGRTLEGLAEFALVRSYLSTAANWGISKLDALRRLFNGDA